MASQAIPMDAVEHLVGLSGSVGIPNTCSPLSLSWFIHGHHAYDLAGAFMLEMPECD